MKTLKLKDVLRMFQWLLFSAFCYSIAGYLAYQEIWPQVQIVFWKVGHLALGANLGYWVDRCAFNTVQRMEAKSDPLEQLRRAVIMAAAMYAMASGM